jgi:hypothetical protein
LSQAMQCICNQQQLTVCGTPILVATLCSCLPGLLPGLLMPMLQAFSRRTAPFWLQLLRLLLLLLMVPLSLACINPQL